MTQRLEGENGSNVMTLIESDGARSREAERAVGERSLAVAPADPKGVPDPELVAQPKRRRFTAEYKLRILKEADACREPGETGALLRREGLYSSHLSSWRRQREEGALTTLARKRGRKPADPLEREAAELRRRAERAEAELAKRPSENSACARWRPGPSGGGAGGNPSWWSHVGFPPVPQPRSVLGVIRARVGFSDGP